MDSHCRREGFCLLVLVWSLNRLLTGTCDPSELGSSRWPASPAFLSCSTWLPQCPAPAAQMTSPAPGSGSVGVFSSAQLFQSIGVNSALWPKLFPETQRPTILVSSGLRKSIGYGTFSFKIRTFSEKPWQAGHPMDKSPSPDGLIASGETPSHTQGILELCQHGTSGTSLPSRRPQSWSPGRFGSQTWGLWVEALPWAYHLTPRYNGCYLHPLFLYCLEFSLLLISQCFITPISCHS